MPLHSVELVNFKSYKGVQTIGPFIHFTAVIGPNGSGKSNLMDAISFVLGVRSAQLRSTQLKDLIYRAGELENSSSSQQQQPNKASVTALYIDHTTGQEYRFCRTITVSSDKSGSSTYAINKKTVKWEHYQATLESHNILVKAKNFLVFQGDVEAIASQNPKSLSKLIDQISGSLELAPEYERKKNAYLDASKHYNDTIARRRIINGEIKDFKLQKDEMEKYNQLCQQREQAIVHHLLWKLFHIESQIKNRIEQISTKNQSLDPLRSEAAELERSVTTARRAYAQVNREVMRLENELKAQDKLKEDKLPRLVECGERLKHLDKKRATEEKALASVSKEKLAKEQELAKLGRDLTVVMEARNNFYAKQATNNRNVSISQDKLKEYQKRKAQASSECTKERGIIKSLNQDIKVKSDKLSQLEDQLEQVRNRSKKLDLDHDTQTNKKTACEYKIDGITRDLSKAKKQLHDAQAERTRQAQTETELKEKLQDCLKKISEAGAAQRETDSEVRMRSMVSKLRQIFPGVSGRLQELCTPVARKHEVAIRIVLGRNLNAVVVDSQKTAFECVEYLKTQRLGRASFIPLDTIVVNPINERFRNLSTGARLAVDLVKHDPVHERAVQYACGNTIICDSTQIARHVVYDKGNEVKAVTLDGTVIHKGGNMSGGVTGLDSSRRFDEREVQNLKRAQEEILAKIKENSSNVPRDTDENLLADISRLESQLALIKDDLLASETSMTGILSELNVLSQKEKELSTKVEKAVAEIDEMKAKLKSAQDKVDDVEDRIFESFCKMINVKNIREYEGHHLQLQQQSSEEQEKLETTVSKLEHQINFETDQLEGLTERLATIQSSSEKTVKALESVQATKRDVEEEIEAIDQEIARLNAQQEVSVQTQTEKSTILSETQKQLSKVTKNLDGALRDISGWNDEIERFADDRLSIFCRCKLESINLPILEGSLSRIPMDEAVGTTVVENQGTSQNTASQAVQPNNYGIEVDYSKLDEEDKEDDSREFEQHLTEKLTRLGSQIEAMIPKSRALEKLEEVEGRLRDHDREFEAARKLTKSTKDEFNEIKNQRVNLFNQAYTHIKNAIHQVYRELTSSVDGHQDGSHDRVGVSNEGKAYLELDDFEEPYLHGIKYSTMPPGKRYRDVEQLSGGEKTMAALALLFAIHSYQPSPFFVLDEVDAALDNTNVRRIADYIKNKSKDSSIQFIVISLKGSFYEKASGLVGIYRDHEFGGTKTLTLNLDSYGD